MIYSISMQVLPSTRSQSLLTDTSVFMTIRSPPQKSTKFENQSFFRMNSTMCVCCVLLMVCYWSSTPRSELYSTALDGFKIMKLRKTWRPLSAALADVIEKKWTAVKARSWQRPGIHTMCGVNNHSKEVSLLRSLKKRWKFWIIFKTFHTFSMHIGVLTCMPY